MIGFSRQPLAEDESDVEDDAVEEEVEDEEADLVDNVDVTDASPPPTKTDPGRITLTMYFHSLDFLITDGSDLRAAALRIILGSVCTWVTVGQEQ